MVMSSILFGSFQDPGNGLSCGDSLWYPEPMEGIHPALPVFRLLIPSGLIPLKDGEVVKGVVVDVPSQGKASIRLKGKVVETRTLLPLKEGEELTFKVEVVKGEVRLRVIQAVGALRDRSLVKAREAKTLWDFRALKDLSPLLRDLKERLPFEWVNRFLSLKPFTEEMIRTIINHSGILLEGKLKRLAASGEEVETEADLKALLLKARKLLQEGHRERERLLPLVDRLIKGLEGYQMESRITHSLSLPLPLWEGVRGDVIFKGSEGRGKGYYCLITIDLGERGVLGIWIFYSGEGLSVRFVGNNKGLVEDLAMHLPRLGERLSSAGLKPISIRAEYGEGIGPSYRGFEERI